MANRAYNFPGDASVTEYALDSDGNVSPIATIAGPHTGLVESSGVAVDREGKIYVANLTGVTVYPRGSNGDVAPIATIPGSTGGVALDSSDKLYVLSSGISVYAPSSKGSFVLTAKISGPNTDLGLAFGLALDSSGNIYVANDSGIAAVNGRITVYAAGSDGDAAPTAVIEGSNTQIGDRLFSIAVDSKRNIYLGADVDRVATGILVFPSGSNGNIAPSATIAGSNTLVFFPLGIALDPAGNIYVATSDDRPSFAILVYGPGSNGNVPPKRLIAGDKTSLFDPDGIGIGPNPTPTP